MSCEVTSRIPLNASHVSAIEKCYDSNGTITGDDVGSVPGRVRGKVRDTYPAPESRLLLLTTDRQSAFDRHLCSIPFKGSVLNLTSAFWFEKTKHIIPNQLVDVPHGSLMLAEKCTPFPVEMVVRSYMTGSTSTSIWKNYSSSPSHPMTYCGHSIRAGYAKNSKLDATIFTPTTKDEHDMPVSKAQIVEMGLMTPEDLDYCEAKALEVFEYGQRWARERGLILVDTKFEMGKDKDGVIRLIDEVMTPDSSRYWIADSYEERVGSGLEPENIDKEFLRLWYRDNCDPYADKDLPDAPKDMVCELSRRYVGLYEMITGKEFRFEGGGVKEKIEEVMKGK
mmetsp:Transcript_9318/g.18654  ORF Transcript_9318/g.18654 Transcript_9318/m.18654 type:complete len:337 (+) Transcript_9318:45-1055(+)